MHDGPRNQRDARYIRDNATVSDDAEAARLRGEGLSYKAIAHRMGCSKSTAFERVHRAWRDTLTEPAEQARAVELARLEEIHDAAMAVLLRDHITVSHGHVVKDDDGNVILDDGPRLAAIDRLRQVSESRRKLLGLDAPTKVSVDAENLGREVADILDALTQAATDGDTGT
jgi:hypothetical protein